MAEDRVEQPAEDILKLLLSKLKSFRVNYEVANYRECVSALYFASEAAVRYVLARKGLFPRTHEGLHRLFALHFVRTERVPKQAYVHLTNLYQRRLDAEYSGYLEFDRDDVQEYLEWFKSVLMALREFFDDAHYREVFRALSSSGPVRGNISNEAGRSKKRKG